MHTVLHWQVLVGWVIASSGLQGQLSAGCMLVVSKAAVFPSKQAVEAGGGDLRSTGVQIAQSKMHHWLWSPQIGLLLTCLVIVVAHCMAQGMYIILRDRHAMASRP